MIIGQRIIDDQPLSLNDARVATSGTAILAMRGAGKSWLNSVLAEGLLKAGFPIVIVDPEGEYWTLKIAFEQIAVAGGEHAELPLSPVIGKELANVIVEERMSLVLDMSDMRRSQQFSFLSSFLDELFFLETQARIPLWVSFEEADIWVPQKSENPCKSSVLDICQRGRKRGLGFSLVSQRPAIIDKTALSQAEFRFFKRFQQPQDLTAVAEYLGPFANLSTRLPELQSHDALVYAPTDFAAPEEIRVVDRLTPHGGATPEQIAQVKPSLVISSIRDRLEMIAKKAIEEKSAIRTMEDRIKALEKLIEERNSELERTKTALELAATLKFAPLQGTASTKSEKDMEELEIRIDKVDTRSGKVMGNHIAHLLFNELTPEERAVFLTLAESRKPLNVKDFISVVDYGRPKLTFALRRLERRNLIARVRSDRRGTFYVANKFS